MQNLQLLLGTDKKNPVFNLFTSAEIPDTILVHFGFTLLEKVKNTADSTQRKFLLARLYNAGLNGRTLIKTFGHARSTLQRWGDALKSGDLQIIKQAFSGQGGCPKLTCEIEDFARLRLREIYPENRYDYSKKIRQEINTCFKKTISAETLRPIFNDEKSSFRQSEEYVQSNPDKSTSPSNYPLVQISNSEKAYISNLKKIVHYSNSVGNQTVSTSCKIANNEMLLPVENRHGKRSNIWDSKTILSGNSSYNRKYSITFFRGKIPGISEDPRPSSDTVLVHHAGLLLLRPLIDWLTEYSGETNTRYRQWLGSILSGALNIEQSRGLNYSDLEWIIGPQLWSSYRQREELKTLASEENILDIYRRNIHFVGAQNQSVFYFDPHGIAYTGCRKILKGWHGGNHHITKVYYQDFIHTLDGEPVFIRHDDNYYDLRTRFFDVANSFRQLLSGDKQRLLIFIIDRGIYGMETFQKMRENRCGVTTWEKDYKKSQWDNNETPHCFFLQKLGNDSNQPVIYKIEFIERKWEKDGTFRQFITRIQKPKSDVTEVSILSDCKQNTGKNIVQWMLNRWIQENDFLYEIRCFGINYITSYGHVSYTQIVDTLEDREVVNKDYTRLCAERLRLKKQWGLELVNQQQRLEKKTKLEIELTESITPLDSQIEKAEQIEEIKQLKKTKRKLSAKLKAVQKRSIKSQENSQKRVLSIQDKITEIEKSLGNKTAKIHRIEHLIEQNYRKLNFAPKQYMDAVKITARNIFFRLHGEFRIGYNNYRNDHVILRELLRAVGTLVKNDLDVVIVLHPSRQYPPSTRKLIASFINKINDIINRCYDHPKPIRILLQKENKK